jgi:uracil-DNA glycosylase family 4
MSDNHQTLGDALSCLLKSPLYRGRIITARGDEEREFLSSVPAASYSAPGLHEQVRKAIKECVICGDTDTKKMPLGSGSNGVMIILNSPRLVNATEKLLYRKEAGELLKKIITSMNIQFDECYVTNVIKCDVSNPLMRPSHLLSECEKILKMEFEAMKPSVVIVFGDIMPLQKLVKESGGVEWFNVEHPITLIKNPELKRTAWNTLKLAMGKIHGAPSA